MTDTSAMESFDYIIVGAGSAGCVLAARLSEDADARVLVLEAGGHDRSWLIHVPLGVGRIWQAPAFNWSYLSEPEPHLGGRRIFHPRGRIVGGSSSINIMAYVRGHRSDFDRMAAAGLTGWSYAETLPYFKRSEAFEDGDTTYRGGSGPLKTRRNMTDDPVFDAFLAAGDALGHATNDDYNAASQDGFARLQHTIGEGRRCSAATAYLRTALARPNLRLAIRALAARVIIEGCRAAGVEFIQDGARRTARAERAVILSAGVYNTPQLLMLSGVGPADQLTAHGIKVRRDLPGVGRNLWDHPMLYTQFLRARPSAFLKQLRFDRIALSAARAYCFGTGFATRLPGTGTAFVRSDPGRDVPDLQIYCSVGALGAREWFPLVRPPAPDAFSLLFCHLRPESRGAVELASDDPAARVRIRNNFLSTGYDRKAMREGVKFVRALAAAKAFSPLVASALVPDAEVRSDAEIDDFVRRAMVTIYHPAGTCRMGAGPLSVVDHACRVRGIEGLRVVDASVIPEPIGGNLNAPVIMMAELVSDLVRGRRPLAAAEP